MAKIITIQVKLLNKENETFKPVEALSLRQGLYRVLPTLNYDSSSEKWEFPPGSVVRLQEKNEDGKSIFVAGDKNSKN